MAPATAESSTTESLRTHFDMLAVTLATAASWWRNQLSERDASGLFGPALTIEQLDAFEGHLCVGMMKLLLSNALERGLSWREWVVQTDQRPDKVLSEAATSATIGLHCFPFHTRMWLRSTGDQVQVQVHVRCGFRGGELTQERQVWPLAA